METLTGSQMLPNSSSPGSCQWSQSLGISFPCLFSVARTQKPPLVNLSDFSNNPDSVFYEVSPREKDQSVVFESSKRE